MANIAPDFRSCTVHTLPNPPDPIWNSTRKSERLLPSPEASSPSKAAMVSEVFLQLNTDWKVFYLLFLGFE
jgi:hypothetical protein